MLFGMSKEALKQSYEDLRAKYGLDSYELFQSSPTSSCPTCGKTTCRCTPSNGTCTWRIFIPIYYLFGLFENMARDVLGLDHATLFSKVMTRLR